jgi:hypothetical protein
VIIFNNLYRKILFTKGCLDWETNIDIYLDNIHKTLFFSRYFNEEYLLNRTEITDSATLYDYISRRYYLFSTDYEDFYQSYLNYLHPDYTISGTSENEKGSGSGSFTEGGELVKNTNAILSLYTPITTNINSNFNFYSIIYNYFIDLPLVSNGFLSQLKPDIHIQDRPDFTDDWEKIIKNSDFKANCSRSSSIYNCYVKNFINSIPFNYLIMLTDLAHDFIGSDRSKVDNKYLLHVFFLFHSNMCVFGK